MMATRTTWILWVIAMIAGLVPQPAARAAAGGLTVAVFDFKAKEAELQKPGALLADLLRVHLTTQDKLRLVERQEMDKILGELKLGPAGLTDEAAARVGQMLGAQVLVVGNLLEVNKKLYATVKVIGVETSRVYGEMATGDPGELEKMATELAAKVAGLIDKGADQLVAKVKLSGEQLDTLKKAMEGKKLPRVFVYIRERAITTPAPDPAAQTEIGYVLKKIGFELALDKGDALRRWGDDYLSHGGVTNPPAFESVDLVLVGEGFSEFAGRTGDLVSSRARVEINVLDPRTAKVILTDRETRTAVDLAEAIAGKTALQETAANLAYRIIPEFVKVWNVNPSSSAPKPATADSPTSKTGN